MIAPTVHTTHCLLMLEPFGSGSHKAFAEGLARHSRHRIERFFLPGRFWKWRMRGAALHFAGRIGQPQRFDGLITTNLMSVSDLRGVWAGSCPPILLYFHESQLTYPLAADQPADLQFAFTDITSALAADRVAFNSHSHRQAFLERSAALIRRMPDFRPQWVIDAIRGKSCVLHPGCELPAMTPPSARSRPPLIIWNHRWEFDKDPELFVSVLERLSARQVPFQVALLGERFRRQPPCLDRARQSLAGHLVHDGYVADRQAYLGWLRQGTIVVSTAIQENFGLAVVEAVACGCLPLLPKRLSYPELLPQEWHDALLYETATELEAKLVRLLALGDGSGALTQCLQRHMAAFGWRRRIDAFDAQLDELVCSARPAVHG